MAATTCAYCGSPAHVWFNCKKKPDGWKPGAEPRPGKHVADVPAGTNLASFGGEVIAAGPNAPPAVVTDDGLKPISAPAKRGRPRIHPDRKAYKAEWMRRKRAKAKAQNRKPERTA